MRQGQSQLDLVGCDIGIASTEGGRGAKGRGRSPDSASGESEGVHGVVWRVRCGGGVVEVVEEEDGRVGRSVAWD